jgi:hypothetical protein
MEILGASEGSYLPKASNSNVLRSAHESAKSNCFRRPTLLHSTESLPNDSARSTDTHGDLRVVESRGHLAGPGNSTKLTGL